MRNTHPKVLLAGNDLTTGLLWSYRLLEKKHEIITERNLSNVVQRYQRENPDIVILDISPLDERALDLIKELRESMTAPLLLLTSNRDAESILRLYEAGADDCIVKPFELSLFYAKINAWLRRCMLMPVEMLEPLRAGKFYLVPPDRVVIVDQGVPIRLTNREMQLLYVLMSRAGRTISAEELRRLVWKYEGEVEGNVLKSVVHRLRRKLEACTVHTHSILTVPGHGYKLDISL